MTILVNIFIWYITDHPFMFSLLSTIALVNKENNKKHIGTKSTKKYISCKWFFILTKSKLKILNRNNFVLEFLISAL
jgi:hypothetical protein